MAAVAELESLGLDAVSLSTARSVGQRREWAAIRMPRRARPLDCAAMARMPLPSLLYYVLVGDGRPEESF